MENVAKSYVMDMPIGYRFLPTDEELAKYYLTNKVLLRPLPAEIVQEIDAADIYSKHPKCLVKNAHDNYEGEREWYLFIHQDEYFGGKIKTTRMVGNGIGFWRFIGEEEPIRNSEGNVLAFKIHLNFFSGSLPDAKKTQWKMEKYRLHRESCARKGQEVEEWVLGRITRGRNYTNSC